MEGPNILSALHAIFVSKKPKVVWGIRTSKRDYDNYPIKRRLSIWLEPLLARTPSMIIFNSRAGIRYGIDRKMPAHLMTVIPNGIDTNKYKPINAQAVHHERARLNLCIQDFLIAIFARLDPVKNHELFLSAAQLFVSKYSNLPVKFLMVGSGTPAREHEIDEFICKLKLPLGRLVRVPAKSSVAELLASVDVNTVSSDTEGFPNILVEALSCGTPCVATDVGDCRSILDICEFSQIVPPKSPEALSSAWYVLYQSLNASMKSELFSTKMTRTRQSIVESYNTDKLGANTELVLQNVISGSNNQ
jgi:glycosyltransferase involved in cell wall biosynthesis